MATAGRRAAVGFHTGEQAVQQLAGVAAEAVRLVPMLARGQLRAGVAAFLSSATVAAITARDAAGRLWTSPLLGPAGVFRAASPTTLYVNTAPPQHDPLHALPSGQPVGVIVIDFAARRRVRINGVLTTADGATLTIEVDQAYGNCPKYIHRHRIDPDVAGPEHSRAVLFNGTRMRPEDIHLVESADTFFLGTTHPEFGNDSSHRGGPAGFVHATPADLWWPDYPGNNMFNSFGNLSIDPSAALLFIDFDTATTLQLSGTAAVHWDDPAADADAHTGRRVHFTPHHVHATTADPSAPAPPDPSASPNPQRINN